MHGVAPIHRKALLAEEQVADRDLGASVLEMLSYPAEVTSSASDALLRLGREPFSLVLLSNTLPDVPGPKLVQQIRKLEEPARSTPVLILHRENTVPLEPLYAEAGIVGFLTRPLNVAALASLIEPLEPTGVMERLQEPVLDVDHLLSFTDGDLELEAELSALFLSSADAYFDQMHRSVQAGSSWTSSVHALKGASANLGARRLAALARAAEHVMPTESDLRAIRRAIDEVGKVFKARQRTEAKSRPH